ncbi:MAG: DUF2207 family protein [Christensenellaceae bacterium]|jgi:uncharacterized membrane protein YgcG
MQHTMTTKTNRIKYLLGLLLVLLFLLVLFIPNANALDFSDYEYYIENYDVIVAATSDKSFHVTETLDVYFEEEAHGIIREIPFAADTRDGYGIENVNVIGAPFTYDNYGNIRIGDPDEVVTGLQQYTITYTLTHYADAFIDYDLMRINLIGTGWDVPIKQASGTLSFPTNAEILSYDFYSGDYGSTTANHVSYTLSENILQWHTTEYLSPYEGITAEIKLAEGAFSDAAVWTPSLRVEHLDVAATLDAYGVLQVKETYHAHVGTRNYISFSKTVFPYMYNGVDARLQSASAELPDQTLLDITSYGNQVSFSLTPYAGEEITFSISYSLQYDVLQQDNLQLHLNVMDMQDNVEFSNASIAFTSASAPNMVFLHTANEESESTLFHQTQAGDTFSFTNKEPLPASLDILLTMEYPTGAFLREGKATDFLLPAAILIVLIALFLYLAFHPAEPLVTPVAFYPPEGLNPAEAGYIIDGVASGRDITSLIYYWAAKGYLSIELLENDDFILHKKGNLNETHPAYEHQMFAALWQYGAEEDQVSSAELTHSFYTEINQTTRRLRSSFTGTRKLRNTKTFLFSVLLGILFPVVMGIILISLSFAGFYPEVGILAGGAFTLSLVFVFSMQTVLQNNRYKALTAGNIFSAIFVALFALGSVYFFVSVYAGALLPLWSVLLIAIGLLLLSIFAPFLSRRTPFGHHVFGLLLGFRNFIKTAEKPQLEMLLNEDPEYYYNILPYAQVLGVSSIWQSKFDGLIMAPPSWVEGNFTTDYLTWQLLRSMQTVSTTMTSPPPSESSSWSGGGSGSSGGSFSGGGSGGGGGSSW